MLEPIPVKIVVNIDIRAAVKRFVILDSKDSSEVVPAMQEKNSLSYFEKYEVSLEIYRDYFHNTVLFP